MKGNVTITAGQTASVRASDIIAGKDTLITGRNVDIESKDNTYRRKEEHEYKKSGLTVSLGGAAVNAARTVAAPVESRRSGRRPAESPVCPAGRHERERHTEKSENRQSH